MSVVILVHHDDYKYPLDSPADEQTTLQEYFSEAIVSYCYYSAEGAKQIQLKVRIELPYYHTNYVGYEEDDKLQKFIASRKHTVILWKEGIKHIYEKKSILSKNLFDTNLIVNTLFQILSIQFQILRIFYRIPEVLCTL